MVTKKQKKLVSIFEISEGFDIPYRRLFRWAKSGRIPCISLDGKLLFDEELVGAVLEFYGRVQPSLCADGKPLSPRRSRSRASTATEASRRSDTGETSPGGSGQ